MSSTSAERAEGRLENEGIDNRPRLEVVPTLSPVSQNISRAINDVLARIDADPEKSAEFTNFERDYREMAGDNPNWRPWVGAVREGVARMIDRGIPSGARVTISANVISVSL